MKRKYKRINTFAPFPNEYVDSNGCDVSSTNTYGKHIEITPFKDTATNVDTNWDDLGFTNRLLIENSILKEQGIKWISCKIAQPEPDNTRYLVTYEHNEDRLVGVFCYGYVTDEQTGVCTGPIWYIGDCEEHESEYNFTDAVIAWAEFPKPYEGD